MPGWERAAWLIGAALTAIGSMWAGWKSTAPAITAPWEMTTGKARRVPPRASIQHWPDHYMGTTTDDDRGRW